MKPLITLPNVTQCPYLGGEIDGPGSNTARLCRASLRATEIEGEAAQGIPYSPEVLDEANYALRGGGPSEKSRIDTCMVDKSLDGQAGCSGRTLEGN